MKTLHAITVTSFLVCAFVTASILHMMHQYAYSIDAWKHVSHYQGDVCIVAVDAHNMPYCRNGVKYTLASARAQEAYLIWDACEEYDDTDICALQHD